VGALLTVLALMLLLVGIVVAATIVLALGSLLAHVFAVTTFEAAVVVAVVALAAVVWISRGTPVVDEGELEEAEEEPAILFHAMPVPPPRRSQRRRKR
jgi:hypothetical protein